MFSNFFVKPSGGAGSCSTGSSAKSETATRVIDPSTDANSNTLEPSANNSILTGKMTEIKAFEEYFIPFEVPLHARMAKSSVRRPLSEVEFVALNRTWDSARQSTQPDKDTETVKVIIPNQGTDSEDNAVASKAMLDELISCGQSGKWRVEADSKRNKKKNRGEENDEDVVCLGSAPESSGVSKEAYTGLGGSQTMHLKLLQFHDNYRPPYFGTWSRKSAQISGRTPFKMDTDLFDYDVVSDEEWEEEPEGEDLSDDEKEADADAEDVEEEEDGFVVPHGYLSDDEGVVDGEGDEKDDSSKSGIRNEARDKKLEIAGARAAMSHLRLRPVVIGCIYDDDEGCLNAKDQKQLTCLQTYAIVPTNPQELPICVDEPIPEPSPPPPPKAQTELTPEQTNELVALVHANNYKLKMFSDEFRAKYPELRVKLVKDAIKSFAEWGRRNGEPFRRWWLTPEILEKYGLPSQEPAKPTPAATATVTATANTTANTTATTESAIAPSKAKQNATKLTKVLPKIIRQAPVKTTDRPNIADMLTTKGLPAVAVSPVSKEVADTKAQTTKAQPSISDFFRTKPTHMEAPDEEAIQPQQREPCVGSAQPTIHILVAKKKRVTPTLEQALSSRSPPTQLANMNSPQTLTSIEPQPVISCQNTANNSGNKEEIAKTIAKADIDTQTNGSSNAHLRSPKVTIRKAHSSPNK